MGQGGAIFIDLENIEGQGVEINEVGKIRVDTEIVDTVDVDSFADLSKLEKKGQNLFHETEGSGDPVEGTPGEDGAGNKSGFGANGYSRRGCPDPGQAFSKRSFTKN